MAGNILSGRVKIDAPGVEKVFDEVADGANKAGTALTALQKQVQAFGGGVATFKSSISNLGNAINVLPSSAIKAGTALQSLRNSSNQANLSLLNLGRVVQDAPFGFLGIANNINPLLESFQRLKASTGSTGGALSALGKSLIGPAGLGIAVSVISSLLIVFGDRLFGASKAAKEAADANEKLGKSVADDLAKLTALVGVATNVKTSTEDRASALKALNQEYGPYLDALGKEEINLGNIATAYDKIVDALLRQAVVKGLQEEIAKSVEKTATEIIRVQKAQELRRITGDRVTAQQLKERAANDTLAIGYRDLSAAARDGSNALQGRSQAFDVSLKQETAAQQPIEDLKRALIEQLRPLLNLTTNYEDLGIKLSNTKEKAKEVAAEIQRTTVAIERAGTLKFQFEPGQFDIPPATPEQIKKLSELFKGFEVPVVIKPVVDADALENMRKIKEGIKDAITNGLSTAFNGFVDAIAAGTNAFKAFGQFVKSVVTSIIKDLVKAVALAGILSLISGAAGGTQISFIKALGKVFGGFRAGGGPVQSGKGYVVGENGPEWFMPNTGGAIVPSSGNTGFQSGMANAIAGQVIFTISGNQLRGALSLANQSGARLQ